MICSIHQPNYIPYLGLFEKINESDIFVFYDSAQFTKGDYHNRNTIKGPNGPILLSLPVQVSLGQTIDDVQFDVKVLPKHFKTIQESYRKAQYYNEIIPFIEEVYAYQGTSIAAFNMLSIRKILTLLSISTELKVLSEISPRLESKSTEALIEICHLIQADTYISGAGGRGYLETELFRQSGIDLRFQDFHHPTYPQLWGEFIPYMSIIDFLMNQGIEGSKKYFHSHH